jgi:hypothetical protein
MESHGEGGVLTLRIISLGAGVQSTAMSLMAAHGEISPMPDGAIFADTGDEPQAVYQHLQWLMSTGVLPFPVHVVSAGHLSAQLFSGDDAARVPFHLDPEGLTKRQCTRNFKLRPIRRKARELLGGKTAPGAVEQWIGISLDEAIRMKPSGVSYVTNRWPLVEERLSRSDCLLWLERHGYPTPPKSSCVFCPYRGDQQWRDLRAGPPADWAHACAVDEKLRNPDQVARFRGRLFVHPSRQPLADVDLATAEDRGQLNLFLNECEGHCGT